jgi:hypothetical protein
MFRHSAAHHNDESEYEIAGRFAGGPKVPDVLAGDGGGLLA